MVESLVKGEPQFVLFVVSRESEGQVSEQVLPELKARLSDYHFQHQSLRVSDHENIGACYEEIRTGIAEWLCRLRLAREEVYVDFTGATKSMSVALILAAIEDFSKFRYVGGAERTRDGLGTVVTGSEKLVEIQNPWETYAVRELERANWLLAGFYADSAAEVLTEAARKCGQDIKARLEVYAGIARTLGMTDRFAFNEKALNREFYPSFEKLELFDYQLYKTLTPLKEHWKTIGNQTKTNGKTPGRETLLELLANAERRAKQSRYDDAVGRLYRAVELRGQQLVRQAFGAEQGKVSLECFPSASREAVIEKLGQTDGGSYKLGVRNLFQILEFSEDEAPGEQAHIYDCLKDHLQKRNNSLLAHGSLPVKKASFESFWESALSVLGVCDSDIPRWPQLELKLL